MDFLIQSLMLSFSVNSLIPVPFLPITIPGLVTCNATLVPVGVFEISACENPASLIFSLKIIFEKHHVVIIFDNIFD